MSCNLQFQAFIHSKQHGLQIYIEKIILRKVETARLLAPHVYGLLNLNIIFSLRHLLLCRFTANFAQCTEVLFITSCWPLTFITTGESRFQGSGNYLLLFAGSFSLAGDNYRQHTLQMSDVSGTFPPSTVPLKSKLPPSCETRILSRETRLSSRETRA